MKDKIYQWAESLSNLPIREMKEEEANQFITIFFNQEEINKDEVILDALNKKKAGYASMIWMRVKVMHSYKITPSLAMLLGTTIINSPGISTMIANYLQWISYKYNLDTISIREFSERAFPMGYPTDDSWDKAWRNQKLTTEMKKQLNITGIMDNMLDIPVFQIDKQSN